MKNLICSSVFLLASISVYAQTIWRGGTPGHETDWMEARNWANQQVPGWEDDVLIPHLWHNHYPEIMGEVPPIGHLMVEGGARLSIKNSGKLSIDGQSTNNCGILLIGKLVVDGALHINKTAKAPIDGNTANLVVHDNGQLFYGESGIAYSTSPN